MLKPQIKNLKAVALTNLNTLKSDIKKLINVLIDTVAEMEKANGTDDKESSSTSSQDKSNELNEEDLDE